MADELLDMHVERIFAQNVSAKLLHVHDGDTFAATIHSWPPVVGESILVRLYGHDAPELHDQRPDMQALALKAKDRFHQLLSAGPILLTTVRRDKYFRLLCEIRIHGADPAETLKAEGFVREYTGQGPKPWDLGFTPEVMPPSYGWNPFGQPPLTMFEKRIDAKLDHLIAHEKLNDAKLDQIIVGSHDAADLAELQSQLKQSTDRLQQQLQAQQPG